MHSAEELGYNQKCEENHNKRNFFLNKKSGQKRTTYFGEDWAEKGKINEKVCVDVGESVNKV